MFPGRSCVVEEIIVPVEVAVVFILSVLFHHPRTLGILDLVVAPYPQFVVVHIIVVGILRTLVCGEEHVDDRGRVVTSCLEVGGCRRGTEAETAVVGDVGLSIAAGLGGDEYHSVCGTGSVHCGGGCIFQHAYGLDVVRIDIVYVGFDAIYQHERSCAAAYGVDTPDVEGGSLARTSVALGHVEVRHDSDKQGRGVGCRASDKLLAVHYIHRSGEVDLFLYTVSHHDGFIEQTGVRREDRSLFLLSGDHNLFSLVSDIGYRQYIPGFERNGISSVQVCHDSCICPLDEYGCPDERLPVDVSYFAGGCELLV